MPRAGPEELRLFFAIPLAEELRDRAVELQRELDRAGAKVKWVARPNLHMTLKFIGEVAADRLGADRGSPGGRRRPCPGQGSGRAPHGNL